MRSEGFAGLAELDILGHDTFVPTQAKSGKLEINASGAKFFEEWFFDEAGQADLVDVNQHAEQGEDEKPDRDSETAEINAAESPESAFWPGLLVGVHLLSSIGMGC